MIKYNNYRMGKRCKDCGVTISNRATRCAKCWGKYNAPKQRGIHGKSPSELVRQKIAISERKTKSGLDSKPNFECHVCGKITECKPYERETRKYCSKTCLYIGISKEPHDKRRFTNRKWKDLRKQVIDRDNNKCRECGAENTTLSVHHVIPFNRGGSDELSNLVALCLKCHREIDYLLQQTQVWGLIDGNLSKVW